MKPQLRNSCILFAFLFSLCNIAFLSAQTFTSSNLPIVIINTHGQTIVDEPKITADMGIIYKGDGVRNNVTDSINHYNGKIGIEIRGSSSQMFPKKQYGVETRDETGNDLSVSLLGMPSESDWILSAQYNDKTLMRDVITYTLTNSVGRYASRTKYFELVINGEYLGVYALFEKVKRDKNRVNISKLESTGVSGDDLTGGYIFKIDKIEGSDTQGWYSTFAPYTGAWQKILYQYHYPKLEDITAAQKSYIRNYVLNFEANMMMPAYDDTVTGYSTILDVSSAVDYFIMNELTKNVDGFRLSFYLYKDKDSKNTKLFLGPVWDFNHGFGNSDYYNGAIIEGWQLTYLTSNASFMATDEFQTPFWWKRILQDKNFMSRVTSRWIALRKDKLSLSRINSIVDSLVVHLSESQQRNFVKWPILNVYVWPNPYIGGTYANEIAYMENWIKERINWIDKELTGTSLGIVTKQAAAPVEFTVSQNFPNPFNPTTCIQYSIPEKNIVTLKLYDALGREVAVLVNEEQHSGTYAVTLSSSAYNLSSGMYFYSVSSGSHTQSRAMVVLK